MNDGGGATQRLIRDGYDFTHKTSVTFRRYATNLACGVLVTRLGTHVGPVYRSYENRHYNEVPYAPR